MIIPQHLEKRKTSHLLDLIKAADLTEADLVKMKIFMLLNLLKPQPEERKESKILNTQMSANTTSVLLPSEAALAALGQEGRQALLQDKYQSKHDNTSLTS